MTPALARLGAWFVAPVEPPVAAAPGPGEPAAGPAPEGGAGRRARWPLVERMLHRGATALLPPPGLILLAPADEAGALGAGLALRSTGGTALLAVWTGRELAPTAPAAFRTPAASRLGRSLEARGLTARAAGRLVTAALPAGEPVSAAAARRLLALDVPLVLAVGGPRAGAWDALLRECGSVLVHARSDDVADLAIGRLAEQGIAGTRLGTPPGGLARAFARAGLALPGGLGGLVAQGAR